MKYITIQPSNKLKDLVSHFWISEFTGSEEDVFTYFSTADSYAKLIFFYKLPAGTSTWQNKELLYTTLQAQTQTHGQFPTKGRFGILGVTLLPYAIPHVLAMPACELSNQMVDLPTLWGQSGEILQDKMAAATTFVEQIRIITHFLETQLAKNYTTETVITAAIKQIMSMQGRLPIPPLADQYCLSLKQFERKFREWSGFTPKLFSRIVRFESVFRAIQHTFPHQHSLTEITYQYGY